MAILPKFFNEATMQIQRNFYLQQLIDGRRNGLIKIITGIRRCGKSYLLFTLFYQYLKANGIAEDHIIKIALDDIESADLREPRKAILACIVGMERRQINKISEY